jgi:3-dehydroquinate synthase
LLNLGHSFGHALEAEGGFGDVLLHGEAVAIGMALESELAERAGVAECGTHARVRDVVRKAGLPTARPAGVAADVVMAHARGDKKARAGVTEYALPRRIGAMAGERSGWAVPVPDDLVREVLA